MALYLNSGLCVSCSYEMGLDKKEMTMVGSSDVNLVCRNEFKGSQLMLKEQSGAERWSPKSSHPRLSIHAQNSICVPRDMRWWEKTMKPNMIEIKSTQELVDSLVDAGDKLVVVDFYSPGCGGCRALHPKICQLADSYPNAIFLKVNYEKHRAMCQSLHIHVLPFFRFYRGYQGRVSSFSCTNATIKKFKDALNKYGAESCSIGPARGLEESELLSLASNRETNFRYPLRSTIPRDFPLASRNSLSFVGEDELLVASMHRHIMRNN